MASRAKLIFGSMLYAGLMTSSAAQAASCIGNCGKTTTVFVGTVTPAPTNFGAYDWVSTNKGQPGAAQIEGFSEFATTGSELLSDPFFASVGQTVSFYFNYITSDGGGFADYGFAQLINTTTNVVTNLFTARTKPSGPIVPGLELPDVEATLSPATVPIKPGAPVWDPLGDSSGDCFSAGCGHTGWILSNYQITDPGTYQLRFGAANWSDEIFDSGLAFSGLVLDNNTIGDGSSFASPLLPQEVDPVTGAFEFQFVATPGTPVIVDPDIAIGYIFNSDIGILSAEFQNLGDNEYTISFLDSGNVLKDVLFKPGIGNIFDFSTYNPLGVLEFTVSGIDVDLMLDPTNTAAFKTSLIFNVQGLTDVNVTQTPLTTYVEGVPEPDTWAIMMIGLGGVGFAMRRNRRVAKLKLSYA